MTPKARVWLGGEELSFCPILKVGLPSGDAELSTHSADRMEVLHQRFHRCTGHSQGPHMAAMDQHSAGPRRVSFSPQYVSIHTPIVGNAQN